MRQRGKQPAPETLLKSLAYEAPKVLRAIDEAAGGHTVVLMILLGLELRWTLVCLDKWSLRANFFSHSEHSYGLMPECERR